MLNTLTLFWPFGDNWRLGVASTKHQRRQSVGSWMQISELALGKDLQSPQFHTAWPLFFRASASGWGQGAQGGSNFSSYACQSSRMLCSCRPPQDLKFTKSGHNAKMKPTPHRQLKEDKFPYACIYNINESILHN
ncbi:uncharacterized protein LOC111603605 isoform X2 [Drosophila hydei]|uniref:Uncharacterized protein LOC111603605 isoform X2 n=1 Tax=Drosophila hydei TaxID=7224 RepID=A0A6J1M776_DROHY|nr:uncharacterized protein LOC111603605 isoform X2 [Drosophila hydei]